MPSVKKKNKPAAFSAAKPGIWPVGLRKKGDSSGHLCVVDPPAVLVVLPLPLATRLLIVPLPLYCLQNAIIRQHSEKENGNVK